jgi:hypothetical protein
MWTTSVDSSIVLRMTNVGESTIVLGGGGVEERFNDISDMNAVMGGQGRTSCAFRTGNACAGRCGDDDDDDDGEVDSTYILSGDDVANGLGVVA